MNFKDSEFKGEMLPYERERLYNWVLQANPKVVLEVGTGSGGGSSRFIAHALQENGSGSLYTCDPNGSPSDKLLLKYPNIHFHKTESTKLIKELISKNLIPDFIFFDGPEDPPLALIDIKILEEHITPGTMFAMHDWEFKKRAYDGGVSIKAADIRPYMETSSRWSPVEVLSGMVPNTPESKSPDSVGLCLYRFL